MLVNLKPSQEDFNGRKALLLWWLLSTFQDKFTQCANVNMEYTVCLQ